MTRLTGSGSIVLGIFLAAAEAPAQTALAAAGAINGRVTDSTGAVLPGVAVSVSSDALMGIQTVATNEEGVFRFPVVPIGEYTLRFVLEGFQTVTQRVYVSIGFTADPGPDGARGTGIGYPASSSARPDFTSVTFNDSGGRAMRLWPGGMRGAGL